MYYIQFPEIPPYTPGVSFTKEHKLLIAQLYHEEPIPQHIVKRKSPARNTFPRNNFNRAVVTAAGISRAPLN